MVLKISSLNLADNCSAIILYYNILPWSEYNAFGVKPIIAYYNTLGVKPIIDYNNILGVNIMQLE